MKEKNLELERLVFFSDAVVAIAITLLALELKIENTSGGHLTFTDLGNSWQKFIAFFLSFFNIGLFWKIHHQFFRHIKEVDSKLLWYNINWLLFIVLLPFTTSLISSHFFDTAAMFSYSLNIFFITLFQNNIWDYVAVRPDYLKDSITETNIYYYRLSCNVVMFDALLAICISFFSPLTAFIILSAAGIIIRIAKMIFKPKKKS